VPGNSNAEKLERDRRVARVLHMLVNDEWRAGETTRALAAEWGCAESSVGRIRGEAMRIHRLALAGTVEEARDMLMLRCDNLYHRALNSFQVDGKGNTHRWADVKAAVAALKLFAGVSGALVHKIEHTEVAQKRREIANQTPEELDERVNALRKMLSEKLAVH